MPALRLDVERLNAGYGPTQVISDITFSVAPGARLAVLGRNGVGKSTLLATLMGLTTYRSGVIRLDGLDISKAATPARARAGIGYVPQTRDIFRSLTVEENLAAGLKSRPRSALDEAYQIFPRLAERRNHLGLKLSGGEQQMLSLARTLLGRPSVLILDEPLEGLAPIICDELMLIISALSSTGQMTVVIVEQQIERALLFAQEILILERGKIAWEGSAHILRSERRVIEDLIGVGI